VKITCSVLTDRVLIRVPDFSWEQGGRLSIPFWVFKESFPQLDENNFLGELVLKCLDYRLLNFDLIFPSGDKITVNNISAYSSQSIQNGLAFYFNKSDFEEKVARFKEWSNEKEKFNKVNKNFWDSF